MIGGIKLYSKGRLPKTYHTPYKDMSVNRHVLLPFRSFDPV